MRGLPRQAKRALEKARDSGILAVEVYNKPAVKFKSGGYITLMVIAWIGDRKLGGCHGTL